MDSREKREEDIRVSIIACLNYVCLLQISQVKKGVGCDV